MNNEVRLGDKFVNKHDKSISFEVIEINSETGRFTARMKGDRISTRFGNVNKILSSQSDWKRINLIIYPDE